MLFYSNRLNRILANIKKNEVYEHYLRIPDAEYGMNIKKSIKFSVKNITNVDTTCEFVRYKICQCGTKVEQVSLTRKIRKYDCPHRKLVSVEMSNSCLLANSTEYITIDMSYEMEGNQTVCYRMLLSQNRTIYLIFKVKGLVANYIALSPYTWNLVFKMKDVFIGVKDSALQAYWFYNNTRRGYNYQFDVTKLESINTKYGCDVIKCLNPTGTVEQKSYAYVYYVFHPIDLNPVDVSNTEFFSNN